MAISTASFGGSYTADEATLSKSAGNVFSVKALGVGATEIATNLRGKRLNHTWNTSFSTASTSYVDITNSPTTIAVADDCDLIAFGNPCTVSAGGTVGNYATLTLMIDGTVVSTTSNTTNSDVGHLPTGAIGGFKAVSSGNRIVKMQAKINANTVFINYPANESNILTTEVRV